MTQPTTPPETEPTPTPAAPPAASSPISTGAVARIKQALIDGKKIKGYRGPTHNKIINGVRRWDIDHIELCCDDILEAAKSCAVQTQIVQDLIKGSSILKPGSMASILTDDAFHLMEQATIAQP